MYLLLRARPLGPLPEDRRFSHSAVCRQVSGRLPNPSKIAYDDDVQLHLRGCKECSASEKRSSHGIARRRLRPLADLMTVDTCMPFFWF